MASSQKIMSYIQALHKFYLRCDGCHRIFFARRDETVCDWCDPSQDIWTMDEFEKEMQP